MTGCCAAFLCMPPPPCSSGPPGAPRYSRFPAHLVKGDSVLAALERVSFSCRSAFQPLEKQAPPQYPFPLVTQHIVTAAAHWQHSCPLCSLGGRGIVPQWGRDRVSGRSKVGAERAFTRCWTRNLAGHSSLKLHSWSEHRSLAGIGCLDGHDKSVRSMGSESALASNYLVRDTQARPPR